MNIEHNKLIRKKPKRNSKISGRKSRMLAMVEGRKPNTSAKLSEIYSTKIEWATKIIPKLPEKQER